MITFARFVCSLEVSEKYELNANDMGKRSKKKKTKKKNSGENYQYHFKRVSIANILYLLIEMLA